MVDRAEDSDTDDTGPHPPVTKADIEEALLPLAEQMISLFPNLQRDLIQAKMEDHEDVEYLASCIMKAGALGLTVLLLLVFFGITEGNATLYWYAIILGPVLFGFGVFTLAKRPRIKAKKRTRLLEKELPYALRHVLIEVDAGVSLYRAMVSVTDGYGEASEEFNKIVSEINAGKSEVEALEDSILRNPSQQYRRALWQIINSIKSGADVSETLSSLVDTIMEQQILSVEEYGKELNPYTLMYMMIAIIMPSLGVTFLMILSTFTGMDLSNTIFYGILIFLVLFQILFINLVESKRPLVKG